MLQNIAQEYETGRPIRSRLLKFHFSATFRLAASLAKWPKTIIEKDGDWWWNSTPLVQSLSYCSL